MDIQNFTWSVIASLVAATLIGTPIIYKVVNRNKTKINNSFNTENNNHFNDSAQQNIADKITINQNIKEGDETDVRQDKKKCGDISKF